jgi:hypothetical protein
LVLDCNPPNKNIICQNLLSIRKATILVVMSGRKRTQAYTEIIDYITNNGIKTGFIADRIYISRQYLYQVLSGIRPMPDKTLEQINALFKTNFQHPKSEETEELLPHEKLAADRQSLNDKPFWKDDRDTQSPV